ncbi:MAG: hypothetical protein RLZZ565_1458 [Planctomycetota bacterium]
MPEVTSALLAIHIVSGFAALAAALVAASVKAFGMPHRWHVIGGRVFVASMFGVFLTAVPLALIGGILFLLLVGILSFYLAIAGWREASRRRGGGAWIDRVAPIVMIAAGAAMVGWGVMGLLAGNIGGVVPLAFGAIGLLVAIEDLLRLGRPAEGMARIAHHMSRMMGATIAVVTAFLVVNVRFEPGWVIWLGPTVLLTPLIFVWARRIRAGRFG